MTSVLFFFFFFFNCLSSFFWHGYSIDIQEEQKERRESREGVQFFVFVFVFLFFFKTSSIKDKESESRRGGRRRSETEKQTRREEEKRWGEKSFWEEDRSGGVQVLQCPGESVFRCLCSAAVFVTRSLKLFVCLSASASSSFGDKSHTFRISFSCVRRSTLIYYITTYLSLWFFFSFYNNNFYFCRSVLWLYMNYSFKTTVTVHVWLRN